MWMNRILKTDSMEPKEIYECIRASYPDLETTICQLHKPCSGNRCARASRKHVIDFDQVERRYHVSASSPNPSVDAVTCNDQNTGFCFVELKGWEMFLAHQLSRFSEDEDKKKAIEEQANDYDLKKKLDNSLQLCQQITNNSDCFNQTEVVFVLVTDIEVEVNPLESFAYQLNMLAETASKWKLLCNESLSQRLDSEIDIKKYYVHCKDFDSLIHRL